MNMRPVIFTPGAEADVEDAFTEFESSFWPCSMRGGIQVESETGHNPDNDFCEQLRSVFYRRAR